MAEPPHTLRASLAARYQVEREVGEGGMATVYLADDVRHGMM
jgi:serine/threonine-protein kinase